MGGIESQVISRVGGTNSVSQIDGVSDMALLPAGSVALWLCGFVVEGLRKRTMAFLSGRKLSPSSCCLDAIGLTSSLYATGAFLAATLELELRGSESE